MVAAKLIRIRVIVMIRRDQRSEVGNEIRVVINMDIPLMPATTCMFYLVSDPSRRAHMMHGLNPSGFSSIVSSKANGLYSCFAFPALEERGRMHAVSLLEQTNQGFYFALPHVPHHGC